MKLIFGLGVGIVMGWLLQRVRASSPAMIARTLRLENLTIIKFMATTIAVGAIVTYALAAMGVPMHIDVKPVYLIGVILGGVIFGVGFGLGGYCPGTCVVGAGEGRKDAVAAIAGGVAGALVFTLVYPAIEGALVKPLDLGKITLADVVHVPAFLVALAMGALLLGVVAVLPTQRRGVR